MSVTSSLFAQAQCDELSADPRFTYRCNQQTQTKDFSRSVSSTMIPLSGALPLGLYATGLFSNDEYMAQSGVILLLADATTLGLTYILKEVVRRPRPWRAHPDCIAAGEIDNEYSFPSGHASGATVMATYVSLRYPYWYVIAPSALYAGYTWYARMNLGVHYPTDILAGALLGAAIGYGAYKLTEKMTSGLHSITRLPVPLQTKSVPLFGIRISL